MQPDNYSKYYIGVRSCNCLPKDDYKYMSSSFYLKKEIILKGIENFEKILIAEWSTRQLAAAHEKWLHGWYNVGKNSLFINRRNQSSEDFGNSGRKLSIETKTKMSNAKKGRKFTAEHKQHMKDNWHNNRDVEYYKQLSERVKGNKNPAKRADVRQKISVAMTGKTWAHDIERVEKHKKNSKKIMTKNWSNPDFADKMKGVHLGRKNSNESLEKMRAWQQHTYQLTDPTNNVYTVMSKDLKDFCLANNITYANMFHVKNHNGKKHKGWTMIEIYDK